MPRPDRDAITLLEVLLVLALLVMLSAMTWPSLDAPMANQQLRKAADKIRTSWARARIEAISSGATHAFRCTIDENRFLIEVQAGPEMVDTFTADEGDRDGAYQSGLAQPASRELTLPEQIRFVGGETAFESRAAMFGEEGSQAESTAGQWSEPILFYPDGTTSTATLILENRYQRRIRITLRGLTGAMTVSDTYPAEEETYELPR